jgi:hypothetical protein
MAVPDTRGLTERDLDKRLRIHLSSGEEREVVLLELEFCDPAEPCCGLTYRPIRSHQLASSRTEGSVYWVAFGDINNVKVIGDSGA